METPEERQFNDEFAMKVNLRVDQLLEDVESVSSFLSEGDNGGKDLICPVGTTVRSETLRDDSLKAADHAFIRVLCRELHTAKNELQHLHRESLADKEKIQLLVKCCNQQRDERDILIQELEHVRVVMLEQKETIVKLLSQVAQMNSQERCLQLENERLDTDVTFLLQRVEEQSERDEDWQRMKDGYEVTVTEQAETIRELNSANKNLRSQIVLLETLNNQAMETAQDLQERLLWFCDIKQQLLSEQIYHMKAAVVQLIDERDNMVDRASPAKNVVSSVDEVITNMAMYVRSIEERNVYTRRRINEIRWTNSVDVECED